MCVGLLDRNGEMRSNILMNIIKQKPKERAAKCEMPVLITKVKAQPDAELSKVSSSGKSQQNGQKRWSPKSITKEKISHYNQQNLKDL